jgi:CubicO group peptidase (beta-lactamase class C family)
MNVLREGTPAEAGLLPERLDCIRERAASWVEEGLTPSLILLVARRGVIALQEAYGRLTPESDADSLRVDSVFAMSSISKPVTAAAVMQLVEDGSVSLNRPVMEYIPELSGAGTEDILVHHLLTHTSGFNELDVTEFEGERLKTRLNLPPRQETEHSTVRLVLNARYPVDVSQRPGSMMMYCNYNFDLVAEIVRRVSGLAFEDFVREHVFEPLEMTDSSFRLEERFRDRIVKRGPDLQLARNSFINLDDERYLDIPWGCGGLKSTARDLAAFAQMLLNGGSYGDARLLSEASVREMTRNQLRGIGGEGPFGIPMDEASYGFGLHVQSNDHWPYLSASLSPLGCFGHGGAGGARLQIDPVNEIIAIYLGIVTRTDERLGIQITECDKFQNMVFASVAD